MYELKIEKHVRGNAIDMVPLSESKVDRAVFNGCVNAVLGRNVKTAEEFEKVIGFKDEREDEIIESLEEFGLIDVEKENELSMLEKHVETKLRTIEKK